MTWTQIRRKLRTFETVIFVEEKISFRQRRMILLCLGVVIIATLSLVIFYKEYRDLLYSIFFLSAGFWLLLFMGEAYLRSKYFANIDNAEKRVEGKLMLSFDLADLFIASEGVDAIRGLFYSTFGVELRRRLGIPEQDVELFLERKSHIVIPQNIDYDAMQLSLDGLATYMLEKDEEFKEFLFSYGITPDIFLEVLLWVVRIRKEKIKDQRWWSRESLRNIPSIGKTWSLGEISFFKRFALPVREVPGYEDFTMQESLFKEETEKIERALAKTHTANVIVIGDTEYARMEPIFLLQKKIESGRIYPELEQKRVYFLYHDRIFAETNDRQDAEEILLRMFTELAKAEEMIVVIPEFGSFLAAGKTLSIDILELLRTFITSPVVQVVGLVDSQVFESQFRNKAHIAEMFDTIPVTHHVESLLLEFAKAEARHVEQKTGSLFTYTAIRDLTQKVVQLFSPQEQSARVQTLLYELASYARSEKRAVVLRSDIDHVIEAKTGVPGTVVTEEEKTKLLELENLLHARVAGQDQAVNSIAETLRRSRSGIRDQNKPIGSFLFLGPTGVGKTEVARSLASVFFGGEENMMRFDMTEFSGEGSLTRLIGDYTTQKSGLLSSQLRENPYGIVLLDEFEKAHREVHDLFLQILDEGMFSDMRGERVNARNTIIIATSNAGSDLIYERIMKDGATDIRDEIVDHIISQNIFRPELLNRFDGVVVFHPLGSNDLELVAEKMLGKLQNRIEEKGYRLTYTPDLVSHLVSVGNDPKFGARPIERVVTEKVEGAVARRILEGKVQVGDTIEISAQDLI